MEKSTKSKREAKDEKQKEKLEEQVLLKTLEEAGTPEQKLQMLLQKHLEVERQSRRQLQEHKKQDKQFEVVLREKENLQREYNKGVLIREKLQEVCREQQKLIKSVKNESMLKIREEEERRKESQTKFQASLNEISLSLNKNNEENIKLRDYNTEMTQKLKFLAEQYSTREKQLEKMHEQVQLESQLHQAKMNKLQVETAMEKGILIKEKEMALEKLRQTQEVLKELTEREVSLKEQLNLYTAKYDDFQNSLQKSNDIFSTYKVELEKFSKRTNKLEKECLEWRRKWEKSNALVIELATDKKERDDHSVRCQKQVEQLQKLLRAMQHERTHLYKLLRENNIECPQTPSLPPEPEPLQPLPVQNGDGKSDREKMDMVTRNCAELKLTLDGLRKQMKELNVKSAEIEEAQTTKTAPQQQRCEEELQKRRNKRKNKSKNNRNTKEPIPLETGPISVSLVEEIKKNDTKNDFQATGELQTKSVVALPKNEEGMQDKDLLDPAITENLQETSTNNSADPTPNEA